MTAALDSQPKLAPSDFLAMKTRGEPIVVVTAYEVQGARLAAQAGVDIVFVGDSAARVVLGYDSELPVTLEEMLMLARAARRGAPRSFLLVDMPLGSYQVSDEDAARNAIRFAKEAGADAVKVEGAGTTLDRVRAIVAAGIPVVGHIGITPQSFALAGAYRSPGRSANEALRLYDEALALEAAGCFALVLECVRAPVATRITRDRLIPTVGIGSGQGCDGQVLVFHDLLGLSDEPARRFVRRYASIGAEIREALGCYAHDVRAGAFPDESHEYPIPPGELARFEAALAERGSSHQG